MVNVYSVNMTPDGAIWFRYQICVLTRLLSHLWRRSLRGPIKVIYLLFDHSRKKYLTVNK